MQRLIVVLFALTLVSCFKEKNLATINTKTYTSFDDYPVYDGDDLGVTYSSNKTTFKLWSPAAQEAKVRIYDQDLDGEAIQEIALGIDEFGVWQASIKEDLKDKYYTFQIKYEDEWLSEEADPYAKAVGRNGKRGMLIDFAETTPEGWEHSLPEFGTKSDIIVYESHIRDFSIHESSGTKNKGKYLAFTETGTTIPGIDVATGLDHLKEMGITHIHLLPAFDFRSIDETNPGDKYNWGYDPQNYNVPEGTYATNAEDGKVRILEFKEMVKALHQAGIRVIMDVVYNHTGYTAESNFNQLTPGYYYRQWEDGKFSDASACGNETASERPMVRKFIIESLKHWVNEYKIDGFRFDLMAIHDIETMNQIAKELQIIKPDVFLYGEGWTAGDSPLPVEKRALKAHAKQLDDVSVFSDDMRDGIKGHWSNVEENGFASGNPELKEVVKFGIVASTNHPQIKFDKERSYAQFPYSDSPQKVMGYVSCHDNNTLYDKLKIANPNATEADLLAMHRLSNTIVMTAQSIPFLHMGVEMKRTKNGVENSYESPDSINQIDWNWKVENSALVDYYKGLIQLRKNHPAFKMPTADMIAKHLEFIPNEDENLITYKLKDNANGDEWKEIFVALNGDKAKSLSLPEGDWVMVTDGEKFYDTSKENRQVRSNNTEIPAYSAMVFFKAGE